MKNLQTLVLFCILMSLFACEKRNLKIDLEGIYEGELIETKQSFFNGSLSATGVDTILINLSIEGINFQRKETNSNCPGEIVINSRDDMISFESIDCDCHCDCSPFVVCGGDDILGDYTYKWDGTELLLFHELRDSVARITNGDTLGFNFTKEFTLLKK